MTDKLVALLIEDDEITAKAEAAMLSSVGFHVVTAEDGSTALEHFQNAIFNLVVIDLMLPDISCTDLISALRNYSKDKHIPIVALTASEDQETLTKAFEAGVDDVYTKKMGGTVLRAKFRTLGKRIEHELSTKHRMDSLEELIVSNQQELHSCAEHTSERIDSVDKQLSELGNKPIIIKEEELEKLADMVAKKLKEDFYKSVGRTFVERILIVIGVVIVTLATSKGWIKF